MTFRAKYTTSCNLFQPKFPLKASETCVNVPQVWQDLELVEKANQLNKGNEQFVLHDGPPYANGPLHLGNKLSEIKAHHSLVMSLTK